MTEDVFSQPAGFTWAYFNDASGARLRYGYIAPDNAMQTIVLTGGFCEPAEKYFEVIRERVARGAAVWVMDWRGQGGSDRYLKDAPLKAHLEGYDGPIAALHQFATKIVQRIPNAPLTLIAHSMGAHIGLRCLALHPGVFDRAVFTDPMFRFRTGRISERAARLVAKAGMVAGWSTHYIPGGGPWTPTYHAQFEGNNKTSDPARFAIQPGLFANNPGLRIGDPTFGWVWHGFRSCDILNTPATLKSIKTPILMEISGENAIVSRAAALRAAALLPDCKQVDIPEAKHEIWMERDAIRGRWLAEVDAFLG